MKVASEKPMGSYVALSQIDNLHCQWTKEDKGSTVMLAMWLMRLMKRHAWDEAMLSSGQIKPVVLSTVELCLTEGIS